MSDGGLEAERRSPRPLILVFVTVVALVCLDQWSKAAVGLWIDPPTNDAYREFVEETDREWLGFRINESFEAAVARLEADPTNQTAWAEPALVGTARGHYRLGQAVEDQDLEAVTVFLDEWRDSPATNIQESDEVAFAEWFGKPAPPEFSVGECHNGHDRRYLIAGTWLAFMTTVNYGAAFGKLQQIPHVLVGGRFLAVLFLTWLLLKGHPRHPVVESSNAPLPGPKSQLWLRVAMTLILAGAIGNLIDNLWTGAPKFGHPYLGVRDFIDVWFMPLGWDYHFPSFNVADSCISVGAVIWVLSGLFHKEVAEPSPSEKSPATS